MNPPMVIKRVLAPSATPSRACAAQPVVQVGGEFVSLLQPPVFTPLQQLFRKTPPSSIYTATPSRPVTFELGAVKAPKGLVIAVAELHLRVYSFSETLDPVPLEPGRLALSLGWDFNIANTRPGQVSFQMLPTPPTAQQNALVPLPSFGLGGTGNSISPEDMARMTQLMTAYFEGSATSGTPQFSILTAPAGDALMPTIVDGRQGPKRFPFTYYINPSQAGQVTLTAFEPVEVPIAFIEAEVLGYSIPQNALAEMLRVISPCQPVGP